MVRAFTLTTFERFCQRIVKLPVYTLIDFLELPTPPPSPFVLLRFDVDYRETHAIHMAHIAAQYELRGSFYFRHRAGTFDFRAIHAVAEAGHETGYHFETLDTCQGDFDRAAEQFATHIDILRGAGITVQTVAAHGSPPTAPTYQKNLDLLIWQPELLAHTKLAGETTLSVDFGQVVYVSDAGWRWQRYAHYPHLRTGTSLHTISAHLPRDRGLYINFHPHQWFPNPISAHYFRARHRLGGWLVRYLRQRRTEDTHYTMINRGTSSSSVPAEIWQNRLAARPFRHCT